MLAEEKRTLTIKLQSVDTVFAKGVKLLTSVEARAVIVAHHTASLCVAFMHAVENVENMLHKQLIAAIGKEVRTGSF